MSKHPPTADERQYMADVAQLGCIACRILGLPDTPSEVHHRRSGTGMGRRASHYDTIPLCPGHHRLNEDAIHRRPTLFVELFGTEAELIRQTKRDVQRYRDRFVSSAARVNREQE